MKSRSGLRLAFVCSQCLFERNNHEFPRQGNQHESLEGDCTALGFGLRIRHDPRQDRKYIGLLTAVKNRLKVLRAERDWSQAELAGRLDVSRQAVNAIETGKHDPSLPLAFRIARLFDMKIEDIFDDGDLA